MIEVTCMKLAMILCNDDDVYVNSAWIVMNQTRWVNEGECMIDS